MKKKHSNRKSFLLGMVTAVLLCLLLAVVLPMLPIWGTASRPDSVAASLKTKEIQEIIRTAYLEEPDEQLQTDYMYLGLVAGLGDQYSTYYTKEEFESVQKDQAGSFEGIGINIAKNTEDDTLVVLSVVEGSPAAEADVEAGDILLEINGTDMTGKDTADAVALIQGIEGEPVVLLLSREGREESFTVELEKTTINQSSASGKMLENDIGYIQISSFTKLTPDQFQEAYASLQEQGMKGLILDLRGNLGGLVDSACSILDQFMPEGLMVYSEDKYGERKERTCPGETPIEIPMVVLVNENTASAAEIMAGAIKDYEVGTIVGTTTYGKGIIQNTYCLSDGSALRLTISHYYTPKGNDIHKVGITPDIEVEQPEDSETDLQLDKALELLT